MAKSGSFEKKFAGRTSGGYYIVLDWTINSQSTSNNSSNVTAKLYVESRGNGYSISSTATKNFSITINGTKYTSSGTIGVGQNTKKLLMSKTVDVKHNSDGTKSCAFAGSFDVGFTLSNTHVSSASVSGTGTFDKINVNSAPVMSGSLAVSPSGTIAENTSNITISWTKATDAQNNANKYVIERFVNGRYEKSYEINNINTVSYTDNISAFGEGASIYYQIFAYDTFGAMSNGLQSAVITKNRLTGATLASNSSVSSSFSDIALSWSGASNTNGNTTFKYDITASGLTVYNATNLTTTSATIKIATSAQTGPYILKSDLINAYKNSNFNGTLTFTLKTKNNYGSTKTSTKAISVDMRKAPTAATPVISEDASLSTALKTVSSTGNKYFIPNGTDKIRITWSGASDVLGQPLSYDVYVKIGNGGFEEKKTNLTVGYYDLVLPKQSASQQIVARVITKTSYGYSKEKDSAARTLHYYNAPSVDVLEIDRTDETATATIKLKPNTSIPNINFPTRSYSGVSSGTLSNTTNNQNIVATGLKGGNTYSWTITLNDDTGFTSVNQTKEISIPAYTPLFSVREKGVGVNCIPNGEKALMVNGGAKINGGLIVDGKDLIKELVKELYPVGSIYMSVNNVNPSTYFGGTWVSWGAGRVPVGINANDGDFNTVEKTGGAKSVSSSHTHSTANHTLTLSQIPAHNHSASSNSAGEHTHNIQNQKTKWGGGSGNYVMIDATSGYTAVSNKTTTSAGAHSHTISVNNSGGGGAHNHGNTGSASVSANVLQPYIVCYMWKRTA